MKEYVLICGNICLALESAFGTNVVFTIDAGWDDLLVHLHLYFATWSNWLEELQKALLKKDAMEPIVSWIKADLARPANDKIGMGSTTQAKGGLLNIINEDLALENHTTVRMPTT